MKIVCLYMKREKTNDLYDELKVKTDSEDNIYNYVLLSHIDKSYILE